MLNNEMLKIAMHQSAYDINADEGDFLKKENVTLTFQGLSEKAKKYYKEPISCNFVSYGNNIVASAREEYKEIVSEYIGKFEFYHCFETPNLHWLEEKLKVLGQSVCFMAEYFLPDTNKLVPIKCNLEMRMLYKQDFEKLYLPQWSNALCETRKELDILGIGAYDFDKLVGFAACSADCDSMWQIGVDVLPEYRQQSIASALTSNLAIEIIKRDKVPFYCCAWSNISSAGNAIKSGFVPAWAEMTVKPKSEIDKLNS